MQVDRRVVAGVADERDHPLRLAQRVAAHDMRPVWKGSRRAQQPADLVARVGVLEHRQAESRLGDEQIAGHQFEGLRRAVRQALVVAGDHDPLAPVLEQHLRRARGCAPPASA